MEEDLVHDSGIGTSIGSENVSAGTLGTATPLQVSMKPSGPSQRGSSIENAAPGSDAVETILGNDVVVVANEAVSLPAEHQTFRFSMFHKLPDI